MASPSTQQFSPDQVRATIDHAMEGFVDALSLPSTLDEPIRYALLAPGKRVRPMLAWASALAVGADPKVSIPVGVSVELIHAFSLVHDDLPALDDDDLRRGRPTLHKHAGEAAAILAGDAMLTLAFEALSKVDPIPDSAIRDQLTKTLFEGTRAMIVGQVYDTLGGFEPDLSPQQQIELIHTNKTGALIHASCVMGAIAGGADESALSKISSFAHDLGLQFQIVDDLLDVQGDPELVGKTLRKDDSANKLTYPAIIGVDRSKELIGTLHDRALETISSLGEHAEGLRVLQDMMTNREH